MNQLADRQLAGVQLTLPDKCSISAADPKPMFVVPSRSACGGSRTTVRECEERPDINFRHCVSSANHLTAESLAPVVRCAPQ